MKNLTTLLCLFSLLGAVNVSAQVNVWLPWACENGSNIGPMTTGARQASVNINTPWTEGTRTVHYSAPTLTTNQWVYVGELGPGIHRIDFRWSNPWVPENVYENNFPTMLRFVDGMGNTVTSTLIQVITEPEPVLQKVVATTGNEIQTEVYTLPVNGHFWGQIPTCEEYPTVIITRATTADGEMLLQDTIWCVPGEAVNENISLQYEGDLTEVCIWSVMKRISVGNGDIDYQITTSDTSCVVIGNIGTSVVDDESVNQGAWGFPNPFNEKLTVRVYPGEQWKIITSAGQQVSTGIGPKTIDTSALSRGAYVLLTDGGNATKVIKE